MRRLSAAFVAGTLAITAAACSGSTASDRLAAKRTTARSTASTTPPFESTSQHTPGTLAGFVGAKDDVHDVQCGQHGATWSATGKVTNPTEQAARYRIYVSFLSGDTTVGLAEADSGRIGAKATESFSASVQVGGDGLRCILRVERAAA